MFVSNEANLLQSSGKLRLHLHQLKPLLIIAIRQQECLENHPIELQVVMTSMLDFHVRPVRKRNVGARCTKLIKLFYDEATMLRA